MPSYRILAAGRLGLVATNRRRGRPRPVGPARAPGSSARLAVAPGESETLTLRPAGGDLHAVLLADRPRGGRHARERQRPLRAQSSSEPPWLPPPPERSTSTATQRPPERRTIVSMLVVGPQAGEAVDALEAGAAGHAHADRAALAVTQAERGESRSTDTTVPSYSRAAALAVGTPADRAATAKSAMRSFFMVEH